jgi:hypothetical protein
LVFVTWAGIISPLSSQGPPAPPLEKKTKPGELSNIPQGKHFVIKVGNEEAAKTFSPPTIQAQVGDMVTFEFHVIWFSSLQNFKNLVIMSQSGLTYHWNRCWRMINFQQPKAHTVAQASFDKPCEVLASPEGNGFNSGKQTVEWVSSWVPKNVQEKKKQRWWLRLDHID